MFKSGETVKTLNLLQGIDCGQILVNHGKLLQEDIEFFKNHPIEMIRIYFAKGYKDFKLKNDNVDNLYYTKSPSEYFIRTLKCFKSPRK
jgi:hypothetical protein